MPLDGGKVRIKTHVSDRVYDAEELREKLEAGQGVGSTAELYEILRGSGEEA